LAYFEGHRTLIFVPIWQNLGGTICISVPRSKFWGDLSPLFPPRDLRPWLHANLAGHRSYCRSKFYIAGIRIFDFFCSLTLNLTRWPLYTNLTRIPSKCTGGPKRTFSVKAFESYALQTERQTDRRTPPKLYTTPLRGWSINWPGVSGSGSLADPDN